MTLHEFNIAHVVFSLMTFKEFHMNMQPSDSLVLAK